MHWSMNRILKMTEMDFNIRISDSEIIIYSFTDPLTTPNAVYGIAAEGSNHIKTADNPVYGESSLQIH